MLTPDMRRIENQVKTAAYLQIRNQLQTQARQLQKDYHTLIAKVGQREEDAPAIHANREDLAFLRGRLKEYVAIRQALMPNVAGDGYTQDLQGAARRICMMLTVAREWHDKQGEEGAEE